MATAPVVNPPRTSSSPSGRGPVRAVAGLLGVLLVGLVLVTGAGSADAATGYKYWNYFHVKAGAYVFATTGPSGFTPADGSVEAYRYGLSSSAKGLPPRTSASTYTAAKICAGEKVGSGQKKVGVLLDYGTAADAGSGETPPSPRAACAVVPANANGQQVLDAAAKTRMQKGLTCGIDGYPVSTCSVTVKNPPAAAKAATVAFSLPAQASASPSASASASGQASSSASPSSSSATQDSSGSGGVPVALVVVVAVVVVLAGGALLLSRRRNA